MKLIPKGTERHCEIPMQCILAQYGRKLSASSSYFEHSPLSVIQYDMTCHARQYMLACDYFRINECLGSFTLHDTPITKYKRAMA